MELATRPYLGLVKRVAFVLSDQMIPKACG